MSKRGYKFVVYKDRKGEFRWRMEGGNGAVVADSGEGYTRKANCLRMIDKFRTAITVGSGEAKIIDQEKADREQAAKERAMFRKIAKNMKKAEAAA